MIGEGWPQERQYVDLKDREGCWMAGLVMAKTETHLRVRSEGWSARYDETVTISQESILRHAKIQPFRTHTRGYTGSRKSIAIRDYWKFTTDEHEGRIQALEGFIRNLQEKSAYQLWQFLRGEHYFYVDFLMGNTYPSLQDFSKVYQYFKIHIHLTKLYIQRMMEKGIQKWFNEVSEMESEQDEAWRKAFRQCYFEIFDALYSIAGLNQRLSFFSRLNEKNIKNIVGIFETHQNYISNELLVSGTFEDIKKVINMVYRQLTCSTPCKLPFLFAYSLLQMFLIIEKTLQLQKDPDIDILLERLFVSISNILDDMKAEDLKGTIIDREIDFILTHTRATYIRHNRKELACGWVEEFRVKYFVFIIKSNSLDRKLRGILKLKQYCQDLIHLPPNKEPKMAKGKFNHLFNQLQCEEILFQQNEHSQIFKKSIELICMLYKSGMVGIDSLIFVWNHSINKDSAVVKHLFSNWNDVALRVLPQDSFKFTEVVSKFYSSDSTAKDHNESVEFIFKFVQSLIKNYHFHRFRSDPPNNLNQIQKKISMMIEQLYEILLGNLSRENQDILIEHYSKIVISSTHSNIFILQLFTNLTHHIYYRTSLAILLKIYQIVQSTSFFLPQNFSSIFLNCLKSSPLNLKETAILMKLLNRILDLSRVFKRGFQMKKEDFKQYWDYFQSVSEDKRAIFYQWITLSKKGEYEEETITTFQLFSSQLKDYVVSDMLCEQSFSNFSHLTKKQLQIILKFFIDKNLKQNNLQEKKYYNDYKFIYRLRSFELIKQDFLWKIFEKCKNLEVIQILNKNLISFYFFYSSSMLYNLKKGRVDEFLSKLKSYLDVSYNSSNTDLIKSTLMLLKNAIELIKDDKKNQTQNSINLACVKAQIFYDSKTYQMEVRYQDTISHIKHKISTNFKLNPLSFKLVNNKNEELGFDVKDIPVCCFESKYFKVVEIPNEQETLPKFIHAFLNEDIEDILFKMLENEGTALQVLQVLDELEFKQQKRVIFKKISDIFEKYGQKDDASLTFIHCFYLLQIKLINMNIDDKQFIAQCCTYPNFSRFLRMMSQPIKIPIHINLLSAIIHLLARFYKRNNFIHKIETAQKCFGLIFSLICFAQIQNADGHIKELLSRIIQNCIILLQEVVGQHEMLVFIFSSQMIETLMEAIFFSSNIQQVKLYFIDRLKKYITYYRAQRKNNEFIETRMSDIFIDNFYPKIIQHFQQNGGKQENQCHNELFFVICKVIQTISPENSTIQQKKQSLKSQKMALLYKKTMNFLNTAIKHLESRQQQINQFLVRGHLQILKALIWSYQELKSTQLIHFILVQCLGMSNKILNQGSICQTQAQIEVAFQIVRSHLQVNTPLPFMECIMDILEPCQKITFWRVRNKWSITINPEGRQEYSGLVNPGCICYMNSLLQQLCMITQFRNGILAINPFQIENNEEKENGLNGKEKKKPEKIQATILQSLKKLFFNLMYSGENVIDPVPFAMTIKNAQKKPIIKINQQMDIEEFQSILFDKLEKQFQLLHQKNIIRQLFGGVYSNQIVSAECPHRSQREQSFISISLEVKKNIYESFKSFVKVDILDGDNKYFCETCNKKVKAQKIQSIKKLPPFLILSLKRFEFNFEVETKIKINDYCQFYHNLKLKEFSTQELNRNSAMNDQETETKSASLPQEYYNYKLRGVVVHTGSADSGHYYSFIDNKENGWYEFNDEQVFPFDIKKLPDEAFGSKGVYDDNRVKNAYLLIYERQAKDTTQEIPSDQVIASYPWNKKIIEEILMKNQEVLTYELVFSQPYSRLLDLMNISYNQLKQQSQSQLSQRWNQFFISYYFLILIRKQNWELFVETSQEMVKHIRKSQKMRIKYLNLFRSCQFLEEFFIVNPLRQRCRVISHILYTSLILYLQQQSKIDFASNEMAIKILTSIQLIFAIYGQVPELTRILRKLMQYLTIQDGQSVQFIIENYSFQNIFVDELFGTAIPSSKQKQELAELLAANKEATSISFLSEINFSDKKQNMNEPIEVWRILSLLFNETQKMINSLGPNAENAVKSNFESVVTKISNVPISKITNLIYECRQQIGVDYLYRTFKSINQLHRLREAVEKGLKDFQSSKYRAYMLLILAFINDPSISQEEADAIATVVENSYKNNQKYFLEVELLNQWIMKFVNSSKPFFQALQKKKEFVQSMIGWLGKNSQLSADTFKKHKIPTNEKLLNRYYGILVSSDVKDYEANLKQMKTFYEYFLNSSLVIKTHPIVRIEEALKPETSIKYFDGVYGKWMQSTVIENQFGYLTIQVGTKGTNHHNLWQDSEKIKISTADEKGMEGEKSENSDFSYEDSDES